MPDGAKPEPGGWNRIHFVVDDIEAEVARFWLKLPERLTIQVTKDAKGAKTTPGTATVVLNAGDVPYEAAMVIGAMVDLVKEVDPRDFPFPRADELELHGSEGAPGR